MLCRQVYDWISQGEEVARACERGVALFARDVPVGVIAISRRGSATAANRDMAGPRSCRHDDGRLRASDLVRRYQKLQEIATALSAEHDIGKLLHLILREAAAHGRRFRLDLRPRGQGRTGPEGDREGPEHPKVTPSLVLKVVPERFDRLPLQGAPAAVRRQDDRRYVATSGGP